MTTRRIHITVDEELLTQLDLVRQKQKLTRRAAIEHGIERWLADPSIVATTVDVPTTRPPRPRNAAVRRGVRP